MKEIVVMAGATDPEKRFLSILKTLFPECSIRIVYAGNEGADTRIDERIFKRESWKFV